MEKNPFKNASGARYLGALFYEKTLEDKSSVVYTLKDQDHMGFVSLYRLYIETADPTEYAFAIRYLDGWEHWELLCQSQWFKPYVTRWRRELETKIRSQSLAKIIDLAHNSDSREAFQAQKFLLSGDWKTRDEAKRGRPSKDEIKHEAERLARLESQVSQDYERITVSKGSVN